MRRLLLLSLVSMVGCTAAHRATPTPSFEREADALLDAAEAGGALTAAWVADATTGQPLYARREATRLLPASTLKVVTTAAALAHLDEDFRFATPAALNGERSGETFTGALVVEASGDPSLGSWRWPQTDAVAVCDRIAAAFVEQGVRRWEGALELRGLIPASLGPGWAWDDAPYDYSAMPSHFVFRENVVDLRFSRGAECGAATVEVSPPVPGFVADVVLEAADRRGLRCRARDEGAVCRWRAPEEACPKTATFRLAAPVAPAMFEACLDDALARAGVVHERTAVSPEHATWTPLVVLESPPLSQLVRETNKESLNLYAERLALELARHIGIEGYDGVGLALAEDLAGRGVQARDVVAVDGSGLSRYNLATPRALGQVLLSSLAASYGPVLVDSLPVAGVDGTLERRRLPEIAIGRVRAKSGSLTGQRAWTGVIERPADARHPRVVFTLMLGNSHEPTLSPNELFERFAEALVTLPMR